VRHAPCVKRIVLPSRQDRRRSLTGSFWALIKRKTRLQQRLAVGASLAVGRIVIVRTSLWVNRHNANVLLHNDFTVWKFSYDCNGFPFV
jgi:hypothetical protein